MSGLANQDLRAATFTRSSLIELKDAVCDQIRSDDLYWNPTYDNGGPVTLEVSRTSLLMNQAILPSNTQVALQNIFGTHNIDHFENISLKYYGNDIELILGSSGKHKGRSVQVFRLEPDSREVVTSFEQPHDPV